MESFSLKTKTGNPVSRVTRRPGIPSPFVTFRKVAALVRWFSSLKPQLVQSHLAVNSMATITSIQALVNGENLLESQTHPLLAKLETGTSQN